MSTFASNFASGIYVPAHLASLDWLVLGIILLSNVGLIIYSHVTKANTIFEYMLMGRKLTLPLFVATLVATWYGGIFGVTQIAFEQGIYNFFTQGIFWYITYMIFAFYMVKKVRSYGAFTLPDLVRKMYGEKSAVFTAVMVFIKTLPVAYAISIGLVLQLFLPISLFAATCLGVFAVTAYAIFGGLRAVVYSNAFQFVFMCLGVVCVFVFSILNFGGLDFLQANLPATYFQPSGTKPVATMMVWMIIACSTTFINPAFYQRCFAASSDKTAKYGIIISTTIWIFFDICTTLGAMYAKAVIPEADSLYAYVTYGIQLLPHGFKGILLASVIAIVLSTLDSFLFIASNILFYDLPYLKIRNEKVKKLVAVSLTAVCTIIISTLFEGRIEKVWYVYKSYFAACLLLPIMVGYFSKRLANDSVFYTSGILSFANMALWQLCGADVASGIDAFYIGCLNGILVFAVSSIYYNTSSGYLRQKRSLSGVT